MSNQILLATHKGVFTVDRTASGWAVSAPHFLGQNVTMVLADPRDGTLFAALALGHFGVKLHRSSDGGKTWEECAVPVYPEWTAEDQQKQDAAGEMGARRDFSKLHEIWELTPGGADQPGLLWAGTIPGGLFKSTDRGSSWELVRSLWDREERWMWFGGGKDHPGIHSIAVRPQDSQHITVGISCGGAWVSTDGGDTWNVAAHGMRAEYMPPDQAGEPNAQDPHRLVQCPSRPETLWVQHHNGIFRSTNAGAQWEEIENVEPAVFGFAVAVHPNDPDTAWFIPGVKDECRVPVDGKLVVTRTRDGGKSFEILSGGLPQSQSYDIVFRHALDVDATGNRLAFGSTTGSLWISEDAGDHWTCISNHLPPIHCVRFAG